jgi:HlyD family secretion protein
MMKTWLKRIALLALILALALSAYLALRPQPVGADVAAVARGPIEITIDEDGVTRIRDLYRVSAPIAGHLARSSLKAGDRINAGDTIAAIHPADPVLLDTRTLNESAASIKAADAAIRVAEAEIARLRSQLRFAQTNLGRSETLAQRGTLSQSALDQARLEVSSLRAQLAQADAQLSLRRSELENVRARTQQPSTFSTEHLAKGCCVNVMAPVGGVVLRVLTESEQVVAAGTPLVDIGDPANLEIAVDLLSADAVDVAPGAQAWIENWGGAEPLPATLRRIEPSGFTKVSALGIEEQRVNAILDIQGPYDRWRRLGNDFSVFVRIVAWRGENVLRVPLGALFRRGEQWAVFAVRDGRAHELPVAIGHRNDDYAEVLHGLDAGERVILHPSDRVVEGVRIVSR